MELLGLFMAPKAAHLGSVGLQCLLHHGLGCLVPFGKPKPIEEPSNHGPLMVDDYLWLMVRKYLSGWWLTYPSEK